RLAQTPGDQSADSGGKKNVGEVPGEGWVGFHWNCPKNQYKGGCSLVEDGFVEGFGDYDKGPGFCGKYSGPVEMVRATDLDVPGVGCGFGRNVDAPESFAGADSRGNALHHVSLEGVGDLISNELDCHTGSECTPGSGWIQERMRCARHQ